MASVQDVCCSGRVVRTPRRHALGELRALFSEWRRRARGRRELGALCDRCLRDIGATRYDAQQEIRKPFWRA